MVLRTVPTERAGASAAAALFALLVLVRLVLPGVHAVQHSSGGEDPCGCSTVVQADDRGGPEGGTQAPPGESLPRGPSQVIEGKALPRPPKRGAKALEHEFA